MTKSGTMGDRRRRIWVVLSAAALVAGGGAVSAWAQLPPILGGLGGTGSGQATPTQDDPTATTQPTRPTLLPPLTQPPATTPTTTDPSTTPTTADPSTPTTTDPTGTTVPGDPGAPTTVPGDPNGDGDGGTAGAGAIPPEAQAIIDSIPRSAPGDNTALVEGAAALEAAGVPAEDAARVAYGPFPVHGPSRWFDDWYYPRWTGSTFRHHQGLDMVAPYGTPVGAPADGIAQIGNNALGGLTVKVVEANGSYWYLAHLSGIAEGLENGTPVTTGQVVGFVGDSGNARGGTPHLHFGRYEGGVAVPPKPYVDAWVLEGAQRVVDTLEAMAAAPQPASVVAAEITRHLSQGAFAGPADGPTGPPRSELLWASAANPAGGSDRLAAAAAAAVGESVDWEQRAAVERAVDLAWARASDDARRVLAPLTSPFLRQAGEQLRGSAAVVVGSP